MADIETDNTAAAGDGDATAKTESEKALDVLIPELVESNNNESGAGAGQQSSELSAVDNLAGLFGMASMGLKFSGFHKTAQVWNGETNRTIAEKTIPVLAKYGWGNKIIDFLNGAGDVEILALVMALVPVGMATVTAFNADMESKQAAQAAAAEPDSKEGEKVEVDSPLKSTFTRA